MIDPTLQPKVIDADAGPTYRVVTDLVTFKALAADTNGAFSLFETRTAPGQGTPPHRQRYDDEAFWVLEGTYSFLIGDRDVIVQTGGYAFVPRGTLHAYTNSGATAARMLILVTPGGIHERFFAEAGAFVADPAAPPAVSAPPDVPRLIGIAQKYGIEIVAPARS